MRKKDDLFRHLKQSSWSPLQRGPAGQWWSQSNWHSCGPPAPCSPWWSVRCSRGRGGSWAPRTRWYRSSWPALSGVLSAPPVRRLIHFRRPWERYWLGSTQSPERIDSIQHTGYKSGFVCTWKGKERKSVRICLRSSMGRV